MENRTLIIVAVVVIFLLCLCVVGAMIAFGVFGAMGTAVSTVVDEFGELQSAGDGFLGDLRDGEFQSAYNSMHPDLQVEVGGVQPFQRDLEDALFSVSRWNTQNTSVENDYGYLEGRITDKDGDEWNFVLEFIHEGGQWQLIAYDFDFGDPPLRLT